MTPNPSKEVAVGNPLVDRYLEVCHAKAMIKSDIEGAFEGIRRDGSVDTVEAANEVEDLVTAGSVKRILEEFAMLLNRAFMDEELEVLIKASETIEVAHPGIIMKLIRVQGNLNRRIIEKGLLPPGPDAGIA